MSTDSQKIKTLVVFNDLDASSSNSDLDVISEAAVKAEAVGVFKTLQEAGNPVEMLPIYNLYDALQKIDQFKPQVIFNLCEGFQSRTNQEMNIAGLWEMLNLPYTGNSALTLGLAQDKILSKKLFKTAGIPTPDYCVYDTVPENCGLDYPVIAKPSREDGSVGITQKSVIHNDDELRSVISALLKKYKQPILVEKFITGREFNISVLGNEHPQVLPPSEISFKQVTEGYFAITSYEAKWLSDHPMYHMTPPVCPADVSLELSTKLAEISLAVYRTLYGRDYGRVDIRMDTTGNLYVLEYNPNPDISPDAGFVRALKAAGISYFTFVEMLINQAYQRRNE